MQLHTGYALLDVKAFDVDARTFSGIASTPDLDRQGHIVDPAGMRFTNPLPLLFHHDKTQPVGVVTLGTPTVDGVTFTASIPVISEPGRLRDRVDEAWQSVKAGLIRGVSIGFRILGDGARVVKNGTALNLTSIEVAELSLVTVPANVHASILNIKSAATGHDQPGDSGAARIVHALKGAADMEHKSPIPDQIKTFEATRASKAARIVDIMTKAEGTTLDAALTKEYDDLTADVTSVDAHLVRLRAAEKLSVASATPITPALDTKAAGELRQGGVPVVQVKSLVPKGTAFVRAACATLVCKGNFSEAAEYAKRWDGETPEVALYLKAAVAAGNTTDATWAGPLVNTGIANDFLELLRPATILGKIPNLRNVPFNTKVPSQTAGGTYGWVGEAKPKPVTKLAFGSDTLSIAKAAGIIILTEELVRLSNPSAEALVRADMIAGIAQFLDSQFIDPAVAAVAGVNPASITNGAPTAAATTSPLADILGLMNFFATANVPMSGLTFIMSQANALALSFQAHHDGTPVFPDITIEGGNFKGIRIVTSQAAAGLVIGLQPGLILYADDGGVTIDASREASIQMDSAPMSPADATTVYVSLWQNNLVGLRAERFVNWKRANANAVKYLTAAAYPAPSGVVPETPPA
jgi:HK97 family phage major capsid protein/HK97 family phage prohead protease